MSAHQKNLMTAPAFEMFLKVASVLLPLQDRHFLAAAVEQKAIVVRKGLLAAALEFKGPKVPPVAAVDHKGHKDRRGRKLLEFKARKARKEVEFKARRAHKDLDFKGHKAHKGSDFKARRARKDLDFKGHKARKEVEFKARKDFKGAEFKAHKDFKGRIFRRARPSRRPTTRSQRSTRLRFRTTRSFSFTRKSLGVGPMLQIARATFGKQSFIERAAVARHLKGRSQRRLRANLTAAGTQPSR